jgi:hypothetical protein
MMNAEDIIGTWRTTGHEIVAKEGSVSHPFGPGPHHGNLVYHANGTVSVLVIRTDPQNLGVGKPAADRVAALDRCVVYVGRYEVAGDTVTHKVEVSLNPAWIGTAQMRHATLDGDRLILSPPPDASGARARITWQRVSRAT